MRVSKYMAIKVIKSLLSLVLIFSSFNIVYAEEDSTIDVELYKSPQTAEYKSLKGLLETIANSDTIGEYTLTEQEKASAELAIDTLGSLIKSAEKQAASTTGDFYKVNIGGEGDATNLKQVLLSLDLIDELNDIRVNIEGLNELKVSLVLMTGSAMNANVEGYIFEHWSGGTQCRDMENAAWGYYKDSMTGWYTEEKAIWYGEQYIEEKGITKEEFQASTEYQKDFAEKYKDVNFANGWDSTMAAEWCRRAFNTGWDQVGHYRHCARIDGYAVGMALAEHKWTSVMQSASEDNYWFRNTPADDMTTDRLRQLITAFLKTLTFTLTYNANEGVVSTTSKNLSYEDAYGELPTPTREGYTFSGWYTEAKGGAQVTSSTTMGTSDVIIYAHWSKNENPSTTEYTSMYRMYNPNSGEHFYTADESEKNTLVRVGWNYEGIGWTAPVTSSTPVYRLYSGTDHHYTIDSKERDNLIKAGWKYEGIGWYSDDNKGVPLYRQYNPYVDPSAATNNSGSHNYTTDKTENDNLVKVGWREEGIAWYGVKS